MSLRPHQTRVDKEFRGRKERLCFKRRVVISQGYVRAQLRNFTLGVPSSIHTVAPSVPVNVTLQNTGPLNRRLAVRGVHVELLHAVLSCPPIGPRPSDVA